MIEAVMTANHKPSRVERLIQSVKRHLEAVRITRELGDTSDRLLADMGISRGDVETIAYKRYGRS